MLVTRMRRRRSLGFVIVAVMVATIAGCGGSKKMPPTTATSLPQPGVTFEKSSAAQAMASVFSRPSKGRVPKGVVAAVTRMAKTASGGAVVVKQGRLLLTNLGPSHHTIYVFPTTKGQVCFTITRLAAGCKKAFILGQPASMDGGDLHFPAASGPPAELAGLTEDGVKRVQVVLNGTAHDAVFGHDAWYYRFPTNQIPATTATKLLVTLRDGSTKTIPTHITKPPA